MNITALKQINSIQGNFLASRNLTILYKIIKDNNIADEDKSYLLIEKNPKEEKEFFVFVLFKESKISLDFKKDKWAVNTLWYWLTGFYILNIVDKEITMKEMRNLNLKHGLRIEINIKPLIEIFKRGDGLTSFTISKYISKHKEDKGTFLNMLLCENIGTDENSFLYKLYNLYGYKDKLSKNKEMNDKQLDNFLNILVDGITGNIKLKDDVSESIEAVYDVLNKYSNHLIINENKSDNYELDFIKELLIKILRKDFRSKLEKLRRNEKNYIGNDLYLELDINRKNSNWYVEAAHIVPVASIVERIIKKYMSQPEKFGDEIYYDTNLLKYTNPKNGLLLPFNYHKFWDKDYFYFDINGKICINQKNKKLLKSFNIDCDAKLNIKIDEEIKGYIEERNSILITS